MNHTATFTLRSPVHTLEGAGLHDATLDSVTMKWEKADVSATVVLLGGIEATLMFHEVTAAVLPREVPWGPSSSINEARTLPDGRYEIEMQSGDTLCFSARSWSMRISAAPGAA
jgi:hypothetical protein